MERHIEIDGWRSSIRFSACHMLLRHDKCSRLHGHSYAIHLKVYGHVDENFILVDFGKLKGILRGYAKELDHRILIPTGSTEVNVSSDMESPNLTVDMLGKRYCFPKEDVVELPIPTTTVEELSIHLLERLLKEAEIPSGIERISLGVDEGWGQGAWASKYMEGSG